MKRFGEYFEKLGEKVAGKVEKLRELVIISFRERNTVNRGKDLRSDIGGGFRKIIL